MPVSFIVLAADYQGLSAGVWELKQGGAEGHRSLRRAFLLIMREVTLPVSEMNYTKYLFAKRAHRVTVRIIAKEFSSSNMIWAGRKR